MKFIPIDPPRKFEVAGAGVRLHLSDCGRVALAADEQVTFTTEAGGEFDVTRKSWGFYATPSTNGRLRRFGLRAALVRNVAGRLFVVLVEQGKEAEFLAYVEADRQTLLTWLDDDASVERIAALLGQPGAAGK
ncbi:MAG TPA: hypothetical protein VFB29_00920 [Pseudolabrys sp.]|nr:hypothetical protein [Pseudolabrys sp.]